MPIIAEDDLEPDQPPSLKGVIAEDEMEGVGVGEALRDVGPRVGLSVISSGAGILEGLGDLLRVESISDLGREVGKNARGAREDATPAGMTFGEKALAGGVESAMLMAPVTAALVASGPGGLATAGAYIAGQAFGDRYGELRDQDFSGGKAGFHASVNAMAELVGERVGLKVLADASAPLRSRLMEFLKKDLIGEEFTTAVQSLEAKLSDRPDMTWGEFLEDAAMTAVVAPIGAGLQAGQYAGMSAVKTALTPSPKSEEVPIPPAPPAPPGPTPEGLPPEGQEQPQPGEELPPEHPAPTPEGTGDPLPPETPTPDTEQPKPVEPTPEPEKPAEPTPPATDGYLPMVTATPDQMIAAQAFDPELFDNIASLTDGVRLSVKRTAGGWEVTPQLGNTPPIPFDNAQEAVKYLQGITNLSLNKPETLSALYDFQMLERIMRDPSTQLDLSPQVSQRYAGELERMAPLVEARQRELGSSATGELLSNTKIPIFQLEAAIEQEQRQTGTAEPLPDSIKTIYGTGSNTNYKRDEVTPARLIGDTWLSSVGRGDPVVRKVAAVLEKLRQEFLPDIGIVFTVGVGDYSLSPSGWASPFANNVYRIHMGRPVGADGTPVNYGVFLKSVLHELGHLIAYHHYSSAPPQVRAKLMRSWLEYTQNVKLDTPLRDYMLEHHFDHRGSGGHPVTVGKSASGKPYSNYILNMPEYFADQAAYFFLNRETVQKDPELNSWYEALLNKLKALWKIFSVRFKANEPFYEWLESLSGGRKISDTPPKTKDKAPQPNKGVKPNVVKPTPIEEKEQAEQLLIKMQRLTDVLHKAGATLDEIKSLSPTGLVKDFDWNRAKELGDKYGIDPWYYGEKPRTNSIDDTFGFRSELFQMARRMPEMAPVMAQANHDIKRFNWLLQKTLTAVQLRKRFGQIVPGVKNFVDNLERMFNYRSKWKERADERVRQFKNTPKSIRNKVFDILLEEDKSGEFQSNIINGPAGREYQLKPEVAAKLGDGAQKGIELYAAIRKDFDAALTELENEAVGELERLYSPGPALEKAIAEMRDGFRQMRARPYVPHTRFGKHTVAVRKEGALIEFYQFESESDAKSFETKRRSEATKGEAVSRGVLNETVQMLLGMPPQLINSMKHQLHLSESQIREFEDLLKDYSSGASFVRRFKKRKDIAGWQDDAENFPRAYADYMSRFANHVSRLRYNWQLSGNIQEVRVQASEMAADGVNTVEVNELANWLERLQDYTNNPGVEYANLRAAATIWYLGANVKSALVNSTSVPMVTVPYLSKRFGWARSFAAVTQAYTDVARMFLRPQALTQDEHAMLAQLRHDNKIDASFASELAGLREGGRLSDMQSLSPGKASFFQIKFYAMWAFQKMEVVNRMVTAVAAYRLARTQKNFPDDGLSPGYDQDAFKFAGSSIQDTQNENAQWNRAEFARGRKGMLTMFMSYQQNLLYQMFGGDDSWMRLLAVQFMVAGLMGLPFAKDLDELIKLISRKVFGSDVRAMEAVRAYLNDVIGEGAPWVMQGAAHDVFGPLRLMGMDVPGVDISGSLSQGRVIPGIDGLAAEGRWADRLANTASDVGGAGIAAALRVLQAVASNEPDQWKRWMSAGPEFMRSVYEGGKMLKSGVATDFQGNTVAQVDPEEAILRGMGFQLTEVTKERNRRFAAKDTAAFWLTRRQMVLQLYQRAQDGDADWLHEANEALHEYNRDAPYNALRITRQDIRSSIRRRARTKQSVESGFGPSRRQAEIYQEKRDVYR